MAQTDGLLIQGLCERVLVQFIKHVWLPLLGYVLCCYKKQSHSLCLIHFFALNFFILSHESIIIILYA